MASIKLKGDTSGEVIISAPSVAGNTTLTLPATSSTLATQNSLGLRNLIINGDMNIDQRNAGASATTTSNVYTVDRFQLYAADVTNAQTYQQVTDAPAGFNKSLKITNSSTAQAAGSAALYTPRQRIEGYNTAHLNWGTSDAQTVTVSFWVKASVTGTYPFAINNGSFNRSFVSNYTISSANTWEYKTVTVAGDTSGTWNVNNSSGMIVMFSLDTNSSYETSTVDAWQTGSFRATSSNVHFLANASATWQITGVQLETGTEATPFEHRPYDMELARCQRYFVNALSGTNDVYGAFGIGQNNSSTQIRGIFTTPTQMRTAPSLIYSGSFQAASGGGTKDITTFQTTGRTGNNFMELLANTASGGSLGIVYILRRNNDNSAYFHLSAEL